MEFYIFSIVFGIVASIVQLFDFNGTRIDEIKTIRLLAIYFQYFTLIIDDSVKKMLKTFVSKACFLLLAAE